MDKEETPVLYARMEAVLNRVLALDEEAAAGLVALEGKVIGLQVSGSLLALYLLPQANGVQLRDSPPRDPDVVIRGTLAQLSDYVLRSTSGRGGGRLEVIGDVGLAQQLQRVLARIEPDWEEAMSQWVGDTAARKLGAGVRDVMSLGREMAGTLSASLSEYLRYEQPLLPDALEVDDFNAAVDRLRDDVERLRTRIERLRSRTVTG